MSFAAVENPPVPVYPSAEPHWGPIGKEVYERTYSRVKADGTNESWFDTVTRVVEGNLKFVPARFIEPGERESLFELIYNFHALPAGRHLWVTGVPGRQFINNCWNSHWGEKFSRHFTFLFERLMEGGGVGASYSNKYLKPYKPLRRQVDLHFVCSPEHKDYSKFQPLLSKDYSYEWTGTHTITDDREGWVESLEKTLDAYHQEDGDDPVVIVFDVTVIRPFGSRIKGFGGVASGPKALMEMLIAISKKLNEFKGTKPTSLLCMEIDHEIGRCVIAGNVRRSARMSMKYWLDPDIFEFIRCKADGKGHWSTNISVVVDNLFYRRFKRGDEHAVAVMQAIAEGMYSNGEPGIYNIDKASEGEIGEAFTTNPCGEIAFSSPWEQCNLGHVNLSAFVGDQVGLYKAMRLMARFLIRATYADIPDKEAREVVDRNRRIGVGFYGFHDWVVLQGVKFSECYHHKDIKRQLEKSFEIIRKEARDYAFELRIPEPIKVTTVAPTGTISKMPGTGEGIHPIFSPYFIRRVRYSTADPQQTAKLAEFKAKGYFVQVDFKSPNTEIVSFYVKDALTERLERAGLPLDLIESAAEIHIEDQLAVQAMVQEYYADNAISFTANFIKEHYSVRDIMKALEIYGPRIKGATLMPDYSNIPQMPMERITKEQWESSQLREIGQAEIDCRNGACPIK
jgi:ribonucleoside-triphosphate reductase